MTLILVYSASLAVNIGEGITAGAGSKDIRTAYPGAQSGTIAHDRLFGIHKYSSVEKRVILNNAYSYVQYSWIDRSKRRLGLGI